MKICKTRKKDVVLVDCFTQAEKPYTNSSFLRKLDFEKKNLYFSAPQVVWVGDTRVAACDVKRCWTCLAGISKQNWVNGGYCSLE